MQKYKKLKNIELKHGEKSYVNMKNHYYVLNQRIGNSLDY